MLSIDSLARKRVAIPTLVAIGALLYLPLLGAYGLWDPSEVRVADLAKDVVTQGGWALKPQLMRPPLSTWLVVGGFRAFGVGELGGRLPLALVAILGLVACFYAGSATIRRRGAWLGAIALATMPVVLLGARQLTSDVAPFACAALAIGGLARAAWPRTAGPGEPRTSDERLRLLHLALGLLGLVLGYYASGLLLGVMVPIGAIACALTFAGGPTGSLAVAWAGALATVAACVYAWASAVYGKGQHGYSPIFGGTIRGSAPPVVIVQALKQIGFGAFPWSALVPLALARAFSTSDDAPPTVAATPPTDGAAPASAAVTDGAAALARARERYGRLTLLAWAVLAGVATTLVCASVSDVMYPAFAALALLVGDYLDATIAEPRRHAAAAMVALFGAAIIAHDFFQGPEHYVGAHVLEGIKWPGPLTLAPYVVLGLGLGFGLLAAFALSTLPAKESDPPLRGREGVVLVTVASALLSALVLGYWLMPSVSQHLSYKGLFTKYKALGGADGELGQYRVPGNGVSYYNGGKSTQLQSLPQLFDFLRKPARVFAIVGADELAPIDQYAKSQANPTGASEAQPARPSYYVVDDANSRFLLLSNQLSAGEQDLNPLRRLIVDKLARPPQHEVHADFEGKVELVGYDLPAELERGKQFKITLYYKVNQPLAAGYKVFLHFDGPGNRFNGDHVPLDGKFPTNYWVPGFYVIDEHVMEPDRSTTTAGWYQIYTGFWLGEGRLKVQSGQHDGENRVKVGAVRVK